MNTNWFKKRSQLEKLQSRYAELMRKSFRVSLRDQDESEKVKRQAEKIYNEIKYLKLQRADK